ncbi:MAG: RNA methyltransferase, partial [bacterium]
ASSGRSSTVGSATWRPASLFYVSCHPASLARDLRILRETGGYCPRRIAWFDMFPQTAHFELAVELGREPGG